MLFRKMLREIRMNPGQFISIFLLATIAMMLFSTFQSSTIGSARALKQMRSDCALADVWMYGEDFSEDDLAAVRALDDVNDAQLRMSITAKSADQGNAQVDVYFEEENKVSMPEVLKGEDFDPSDTEGQARVHSASHNSRRHDRSMPLLHIHQAIYHYHNPSV